MIGMRRRWGSLAALPFVLLFAATLAAREQSPSRVEPAASRDQDVKKLAAERLGARDDKAKAVATLAAAKTRLENVDVEMVLKRFPGLTTAEMVRRLYRSEPLFRKSLLDIERLEGLRAKAEKPEPKVGQPVDLPYEGEIREHEDVLKNLIAAAPPNFKTVPVAAEVAVAVEALADQIRRNPMKPSEAPKRLGLYMIDVETGKAFPAADEPDPDFTYCGSPDWSRDGKRIFFDTIPAPGNKFSLTRLRVLEVGDKKPKLTDLGPGNCPTPTPDGAAIVFLLNPGAVAGDAPGVWSMKGDGSQRSPLCEYGRPRMSPDGNHLMVVPFSTPYTLSMLDVNTGEFKPVPFPGYKMLSFPVWADPKSIVTMVQSEFGSAIALIDTADPTALKLKELLWKQDDNADLFAAEPAYSPVTGRCVFVGLTAEGRALYTVMKGSLEPPKRLETGPFDNVIETLTFSPDGRYLLFCSDRRGDLKK